MSTEAWIADFFWAHERALREALYGPDDGTGKVPMGPSPDLDRDYVRGQEPPVRYCRRGSELPCGCCHH